MNNAITVAIMIDAWLSDHSPINIGVFREIHKGIHGILIPTFGFEPDAAYFAGLYPEECGGGAHYWHETEDQIFRFTRWYPSWSDRLPELPELVLRRLTKWLAQKKTSHSSVRYHCSTARIPFRFLRHFGPAMKQMQFEPGFVSRSTIFDVLREANLTWFYHGAPLHRVDSQTVIKRVEQDLWPPCAFTFLHIGDLDGVGHKFGSDSTEYKETVKRVKDCVDRICRIVDKRFDKVHLVIFGDHGMMTVQRHLDIWHHLKRLDLEVEKDYLFFLDSTMVRFWFFNKRASREIKELLTGLDGGKILNTTDQTRYRIRYPHNKFGDLLFLADPGVLVFPNFFQNKHPVKGMHGYAPETPEQQSAVVISSSLVTDSGKLHQPVDMRRLFPTLLTLMDLPIPPACEVESLV